MLVSFSLAFQAKAYDFKTESGLDKTADGMGYDASLKSQTIFERIGSITAVILSFIGVIFLLISLYAGYLWMTAQGDKAQVQKAKTMITQAAVGMLVVVSAYAITMFIGTLFPNTLS